MDLKNAALRYGIKLMSDPHVMKFMQDERLMKATMVAMSIPGRLSGAVQEHGDRLAHVLSFATEQEMRNLRRTVRSLEDQIVELKHELEQVRAARESNS